ncbi:MAG TPA: 5-(carboxyamino)imidazole ribonucleotide synthase [Abditibacteriaceae bacterium]|jgi:5-(carboxyamino)imidazole ribonucleotide synthase
MSTVDSQPILPGATVGVLGSGQLGRMFAIAARRMGYRVHTFSPDEDTPTGQIADEEIVGEYDDLDAVAEFARNVAVVTFEFENVPSAATETCARFAPVRPGGHVLHTTQNRLREKTWLQDNGFPVAPFQAVRSADELKAALQTIGAPSILKTAGFGYDGKGQVKILSHDQADVAWNELQTDAVLEGFVDFQGEASVVAARGVDGSFAAYPLALNTHVNGILDLSVVPAPVDEKLAREAEELARAIFEKLDVVGVLCVELFLTSRGWVVNELAPRPHNSGHWSFDFAVTSQFEQQLRAVCGLPLGSTEALCPSAMAQLLGDEWQNGEPNWTAALGSSEVKLHLYGKAEARDGRKMGHLSARGETVEAAQQTVLAARAVLQQE